MYLMHKIFSAVWYALTSPSVRDHTDHSTEPCFMQHYQIHGIASYIHVQALHYNNTFTHNVNITIVLL